MTLISLAIAGAVGVLLRYGAQLALGATPWTTFAINVVGSFAIGLAYASDDRLPPPLRLAVMTGLLGGFTTFSAYSLDSLTLLNKGLKAEAVLYFAATPIFSLAATFLGAKLAS